MPAYTNSVCAFGDDDKVTTVYTYKAFPLGLYREEDGKGYIFVKFNNGAGNVAAADGGLAYFKDASNYEVTSDESDSEKVPAGFFVSVPADTNHCWVQVRGEYTIKTAGGDAVVAGDALVPTTTDLAVDRIADPAGNTAADIGGKAREAAKRVAWALAADDDANNNVLAYIDIKK